MTEPTQPAPPALPANYEKKIVGPSEIKPRPGQSDRQAEPPQESK